MMYFISTSDVRASLSSLWTRSLLADCNQIFREILGTRLPPYFYFFHNWKQGTAYFVKYIRKLKSSDGYTNTHVHTITNHMDANIKNLHSIQMVSEISKQHICDMARK